MVLSTIHKAKGREARRVFLLFPEELAPPPAAAHVPVQPYEDTGSEARTAAPSGVPDPDPSPAPTLDDEAEANVLFVALTRAKEELVLVERTPGALAGRLAEHRARRRAGSSGTGSQGPGSLASRWSEALSLAQLMARRTPHAWRRLGPGRRGGQRAGRKGDPGGDSKGGKG